MQARSEIQFKVCDKAVYPAQGVAEVVNIEEKDILVEYPMGRLWKEQTGCERFVQLRPGLRRETYALVRNAAAG